jgi:hypothetical protein
MAKIHFIQQKTFTKALLSNPLSQRLTSLWLGSLPESFL